MKVMISTSQPTKPLNELASGDLFVFVDCQSEVYMVTSPRIADSPKDKRHEDRLVRPLSSGGMCWVGMDMAIIPVRIDEVSITAIHS